MVVNIVFRIIIIKIYKVMEDNKIQQFEEEKVGAITKEVNKILKEEKTLTNRQIIDIIEGELNDEEFYKNLEDFQSHYSKERIKESVFSNINKNKGGDKPLGWFNFYVYLRMPLGIITSAMYIYFGGLIAFLSIIDIIIIGLLFWGFKKRKLWAYKMNFIVLIAETILRPLGKSFDFMSFVIFVIITGLLWLLPNWIYFKKRKYLFLYSYDQSTD